MPRKILPRDQEQALRPPAHLQTKSSRALHARAEVAHRLRVFLNKSSLTDLRRNQIAETKSPKPSAFSVFVPIPNLDRVESIRNRDLGRRDQLFSTVLGARRNALSPAEAA